MSIYRVKLWNMNICRYGNCGYEHMDKPYAKYETILGSRSSNIDVKIS